MSEQQILARKQVVVRLAISERCREGSRKSKQAQGQGRFNGNGVVAHAFEDLQPKEEASDKSSPSLLNQVVQSVDVVLELGRLVLPLVHKASLQALAHFLVILLLLAQEFEFLGLLVPDEIAHLRFVLLCKALQCGLLLLEAMMVLRRCFAAEQRNSRGHVLDSRGAADGVVVHCCSLNFSELEFFVGEPVVHLLNFGIMLYDESAT